MSALYDGGRQAFAEGDIDWLADDIRVILVDTADYTVNLATHDFLDDVPAGARVAVSGSLTGKTTTAGVCDADNPSLGNVTGDQSEALIVYRHTGTESTSRLIAYIDSATGLPVTPNSGPISVEWNNGANRIFKL